MNFSYLNILWSRKEIRLIIISTIAGGLLQIMARQYLKNHPELLEENNETRKETIKNNNKEPNLLPPGGAFIEVTASGIAISIGKLSIKKAVVQFLAGKGLITGFLGGSSFLVTKIPSKAISTYLYEALPQNLPDFRKNKFILVAEEKIHLDQCDHSLKYLFEVLQNQKIPFDEKQKTTGSILQKYLNLDTADGRISIVLCIVFILYIFSVQDGSSYFIILKNLIDAIKKGKISKIVGRAIIRKLKRKGLLVDPELIEIVNS